MFSIRVLYHLPKEFMLKFLFVVLCGTSMSQLATQLQVRNHITRIPLRLFFFSHSQKQ